MRVLLFFTLSAFVPVNLVALEGKILKSDKDVQVPTALIRSIEESFVDKVRDAFPKDTRTDLQVRMEIPRELLRLNMFLDKKGGHSLNESVSFRLPPGGASVDLASYLLESRGLFRLKFELASELSSQELDSLQVYFIPMYKRIVFGNEMRGVGCDKYLDLTDYFHSAVLSEGVLLTTTENAYLPVIGGSFLFIVIRETGIKMASVSLLDSRSSSLICEREDSGRSG